MPGVLCHSLEILDRAKDAWWKMQCKGTECSQNLRRAFPWQLKTTDGLFIMYMQSEENAKERSKEMKLKSKRKQEANPKHFSSFTLEPC